VANLQTCEADCRGASTCAYYSYCPPDDTTQCSGGNSGRCNLYSKNAQFPCGASTSATPIPGIRDANNEDWAGYTSYTIAGSSGSEASGAQAPTVAPTAAPTKAGETFAPTVATAATSGTIDTVKVSFAIAGVDLTALEADSALQKAFKDSLAKTLASKMVGIAAANIQVTLTAVRRLAESVGRRLAGVSVSAVITPSVGFASSWATSVKADIATAVSCGLATYITTNLASDLAASPGVSALGDLAALTVADFETKVVKVPQTLGPPTNSTSTTGGAPRVSLSCGMNALRSFILMIVAFSLFT